jgi:hypothetical protein
MPRKSASAQALTASSASPGSAQSASQPGQTPVRAKTARMMGRLWAAMTALRQTQRSTWTV